MGLFEEEDAAVFRALDEAVWVMQTIARTKEEKKQLRKLRRRLLGLIEYRMNRIWRTRYDHLKDSDYV